MSNLDDITNEFFVTAKVNIEFLLLTLSLYPQRKSYTDLNIRFK